MFLGLLAHANNAQQAFSSNQASTFHLAIPALEALHRAWFSRAEHPKYEQFAPALEAAYTKIDNYYEKTTESPAYILAMILNPKEKMSYFKKHWSTELQDDIVKCVEEVFKEWYLLLSQDLDVPESKSKKTKKGLRALLWELSSDDEDNDTNSHPGVSEDPDRPWSHHFWAYINVSEQVPDGWSVIKWWGVNSSHYHPAWASLARDYLSIMSSSVSKFNGDGDDDKDSKDGGELEGSETAEGWEDLVIDSENEDDGLGMDTESNPWLGPDFEKARPKLWLLGQAGPEHH
ncbi:hypothetical protein BYT27DRAFT_7215186 [Phlegmacium glaucopus]|nr:hypothetical protein BYT27DRAFT_7215186 [Phlegmacium glaucopus]